MEKLYTATELAEYLDTHPGTLANWRIDGNGPKYIKVGGNVRYREADITDWLESRSMVKTRA